MADYDLTYPSTLEAERECLEYVDSLLTDREGFGAQRRGFMLALSEAFTNAVIHGNRRDLGKRIKIRLAINERRLSADIIDEGRGGLSKVMDKRSVGPLAEGGRGVDLMRHFATSVEFTETASGGLKVSISLDIERESKLSERR